METDPTPKIEPPNGPTVVELPSTSSEPVIWPEPIKRPEGWEPLDAEYLGYDEGTFDVYFEVWGGCPPYMVDFGDGETLTDVQPREVKHTYAMEGSYTVSFTDIDNPPVTITESLIIEKAEEPEPPLGEADPPEEIPIEPEPDPPLEGEQAPWSQFGQHKQFEEYWTSNDLGDYPEGWSTMNIAAKKTWMDENVVP